MAVHTVSPGYLAVLSKGCASAAGPLSDKANPVRWMLAPSKQILRGGISNVALPSQSIEMLAPDTLCLQCCLKGNGAETTRSGEGEKGAFGGSPPRAESSIQHLKYKH